MNRRTQAALLVCISSIFLVAGSRVPAEPQDPKPAGENLLPNPSFEKEAGQQPADWATHTWGGTGSFEYADTGRTGKRCVAIASEKGADVGWHAEVPVQPFSTYRLSGWIKTENVKTTNARGALFNLHNVQPAATGAVTGTRDWTQVEMVFETLDQDYVQVNCLFGGWGLATGKAWYDDLQLERLSSTTLKPSITIDAGRKGEPISKYIYGQFIEHLGRCIYGGIWAEMLEDRKFYFPVTPNYDPYKRLQDSAFPVVGASPWEIVGPEGSVEMIRENSFVGDQTPRIKAGSGIRQHDLGLVAGKEYAGYVWIKPAEKQTQLTVSLSWGDEPSDKQGESIEVRSDEYKKQTFRFTARKTTGKGALAVEVKDGDCLVGTVSLMPADNVEGMRADTLAALKELDSPVYRWPGGNFVSGYDWKDGIGPRDRRPPRKNPAWTGVEHNDFGIDEFITYCRLLKTDPLVVVNSGQGGVEMAVAELQYANGGPDTPMGKLRAQNGHPEPYAVKFWGVGNEMYGGWQLGHMPLEKYVLKHNEFADALRAVDPAIKLVAVGAVGRWSEMMMAQCAEHMDLISEHFYVQDRPGLISHVAQMRQRVHDIATAHRRYREQIDSLKGKDIRIALDEWNYWYGPHLYGELGTRYFLRDALGVAAALNELARNSDLYFMGNYAQTVNVIGCIKTSKTHAALATTGLALKLYRQQFGVVPVAVEAAQPIDAMAAWSEDGKTLTVAVVNPTMEKLDVPLAIEGAKLTGSGRLWTIAGPGPMAYNDPGKEPSVTIQETPVTGITDKLSVAPCSISLYALGTE